MNFEICLMPRALLLIPIAIGLTMPVQADRLDSYVAAQMQQHHVPGLALSVIHQGKTIKAQAYGFANLEWQIPATVETVFEIGSLTKQFTATCILMLVEEQKLALDDPVLKYLDGPVSWKSVTLRHLLTHTSGLKTYTDLPGFEASRHLKPREFIEKISSYPLAFAPGEKFAYCNTGYNLLGFIIEKVSGQSYSQFLSERIFLPLDMKATRSRDLRMIVAKRAAGYEIERQTLVNRDFDLTDVFSAGNLLSTVLDLAKWNGALDSEKLLKASSRKEMWRAFTLNNGKSSGYGFGWRVDAYKDRKNIGHSGSTSGFSASFQRFPEEKLAIIILCNSGEPNIATTLARGIADLYFKKEFRDPGEF